LLEALIKVVAIVAEVVKAEAVKADEVEEVAIKAGANIEVEDAVVELEEEVTITLIIGHHH
jgi:uncharacterized protein YybS (DUF2232 family)